MSKDRVGPLVLNANLVVEDHRRFEIEFGLDKFSQLVDNNLVELPTMSVDLDLSFRSIRGNLALTPTKAYSSRWPFQRKIASQFKSKLSLANNGNPFEK